MFGRRKKRDEQQRAAKEQHALDPRLAAPSFGFRFARPADFVEDEGTAVAGPGGSPEDPLDAQQPVS
jgi:hypothetical protein